MERFAPPINCDLAPRPVMVREVDCPSRLVVPSHTHRRAEFVYVYSGTLSVTADGRVFTVASQSALLIPAGTVHDMRMLSDTRVLNVYVSLPLDDRRLEGCRDISVSGLLLELMRAAVDLPAAYDATGRDGRIMDLLTAEIAWLISQPPAAALVTPAPRDARLLRVCRALLVELDRAWAIDDAAAIAGMGRRTFTRAFRRETGISFNSWHLRARLNAAINRLGAGASITEVAFESGYSNPSAFAAVFKRCFGVPPSGYRHSAIVSPGGP